MRSSLLARVGAAWLARMRLGAPQLLVGKIARTAHQLFLALQQAQAHPLLGIFHIAAQGFLLALGLFGAQVPEGSHDGCQEHQHGSQRGERGKPVLPRGRQAAPPLAPPARRGRNGRNRGGGRGIGGLHVPQV
jgi:hypothetical protein